jgi:hypothetical protein
MDLSRKTSARRGGTAGSFLGMLVGGILLLAIGFVLGWGLAGELGPDEFDAAGDAADGGNPPTPDAQAQEQAELIADKVAEKLSAGETDPWTEAEMVASLVVDMLRQPARRREMPSEPAEAKVPPPVTFDPPELNFGVIPPDTELHGTVQIRNTGDAPLTIRSMRADCKCTTVEDLTGKIIEPGGSLELTAVVDARSHQGTKRNEIRFLFEGYEDYGPVAVKILSEVAGAIRMDPAYFDLTTQWTGELALHSGDGRPFRILAANGAPPVYADDFDPARDEPRSDYLLSWDMTMYDPMTCEDAEGNRMPNWWVVETDHPEAPIVDVFVRHNPCTLPEPPEGRMWYLSERRVLLGELAVGESAEFTVYMKWRGDQGPADTIGQVRSESGQFDATMVELDRVGERITCRVRVTPRADLRGLLYGKVRFLAANMPAHSQPVTVMGRVVEAVGGQAAGR